MEHREQEIFDKLQEKVDREKERVPVPDCLKPDNVRELLERQEKKKYKKGWSVGRTARFCGGIAACLALAAGMFIGIKQLEPDIENSDNYTEVMEDMEDTEETSGGIQSASSYDEIYEYLQKGRQGVLDSGNQIRLFGNQKEADVTEEYSVDSADMISSDTVNSTASTGSAAGAASATANPEAAMADEAKSSDYSETNVRQQGVDEADIVKTDGKYLYILKDDGKEIAVVTAGKEMEQRGKIRVDGDREIREFYVLPSEKKLIYAADIYESENEYVTGKAEVVTCDISDPEKPEKLGSVSQSGSYTSSRFSGGYVYLFSHQYVYNEIERDHPDTFVPIVNGNLLEEKNIYLPPFEKGCEYEVITSINPDAPSEAAGSKAIFTDGGEMYVSSKNIYYYETKWNDKGEKEQTVIRRIRYKDGKLTPKAKGEIDGYINDSFSIDEYDGYLRIVATVGETNSVYVLDEKLKQAGAIEGLAKDERIYSSRFMGETGYFVTYRETDPLFSVDLSNPEKPRIMGKLKIPGFSEYLHFYGEGKLLGIGMSMDEETQVTEGVKISMFDISDPVNVKEENTFILEDTYSADALYDYKAVLADAGTNRIGFAAYQQGAQLYYLFHYDEKKGFVCDLSEEINGIGSRSARGVYVKDILFVVQGNVIEAYSLKDFKKVDDLIL